MIEELCVIPTEDACTANLRFGVLIIVLMLLSVISGIAAAGRSHNRLTFLGTMLSTIGAAVLGWKYIGYIDGELFRLLSCPEDLQWGAGHIISQLAFLIFHVQIIRRKPCSTSSPTG